MENLRRLDELMANAWPAAETVAADGWLFRFTSGVTRRANSALAIGGEGRVTELVDAGEEFYRGRSVVPKFQVSQASAPKSLVGVLATRGYQSVAPTLMAHARTESVLDRLSGDQAWDVGAASVPTADWFSAYWSVESSRRSFETGALIVRDVLLSPSLPAVYVSASRDGQICAVGQIVIEDGWAGVQCMATPPTVRRQGAATAVLAELALQARGAGANGMYLAVMMDNVGARRFYERASFVASHRYSYYVAAV